ncbi:Nif3-like dinuclear metal center hexameric protein [Sporosarcina limicola]|uniref:GTP cyclohydrolase 1 type 2 homolog n=1 Tax=Sporosarcina limicola TaxID=34101 RepID=A0A927MFN4_9BACL|nr:dinuclear metal center YbgI/SA1388 family protein [Sporosarcina limicola]
MKKVNGQEIIALFEKWSPKRFAMEGDPVGLHIGQLNRPVDKVLVTLDVNEKVVDEAIQQGVNLIIAHHPLIFRPLKNILTDTPQGRLIEKCIKNDISVYAAHTNLDIAPGGVNDMLASKLGLIDTEVVEQTYNEYGLGRIGKPAEKMTLKQFAEHVKSVFGVPTLRFVGNPEKVIRKVAVLGGDGNKYIGAAKRSGADVLVTGDLYYHIAHDAEAMGLAVIDPGHNIEKVMIEGVVEYMMNACKEAGFNVEFLKSEISTEPFNFI